MDESTEEIRRAADIVEVISQYVALRPAGAGRWKACCPFHDEKTPSFNVSRDRGFFKCFGCGKSGDVFRFVQDIENVSFFEAKKQLAERYNIVLKSRKDITPEQQAIYDERDKLLKINAATAAFFREQFSGNKGLPARDYARGRGLSRGTLDKFGIGYAPDAWDALHHHLVNKYGFALPDCANAGVLIERESEDGGRARYYDRYRHRLMFPIWDTQGRVIAFGGRVIEGAQCGPSDAKYINSPEGPLFNKSRVLYGWHLARPEVGKRESVIICEGYMDAIALHEAGFTNTMATLGTALTTQHVANLARLAPKIVYLCYDGDSAGMRAALRSVPIFAQHDLNVRVVMLPGGDDPDTFIRKHGEIGFQNALRAAPMLARYRVEMAIKDFDMSVVGERMEAIKAATEVIAEVSNTIERDSYRTWLSERWAQAEGVTSAERRLMIDAAVTRQIEEAIKRKSANGSPNSNSSASRQNSTSSSSQGQKRQWIPPEEWKKLKSKGNQSQTPSAPIADDIADVNETLSRSVDGSSVGIIKAERMLLTSLMGNPSWRSSILAQIPNTRWTQDTHREIAESLRNYEEDSPLELSTFINSLSEAARDVAGELILSDEAQTTATYDVVSDLVARLEGNYARQVEQEILELYRLKLDRGERPTEEEQRLYNEAITATKRKRKPEPKN